MPEGVSGPIGERIPRSLVHEIHLGVTELRRLGFSQQAVTVAAEEAYRGHSSGEASDGVLARMRSAAERAEGGSPRKQSDVPGHVAGPITELVERLKRVAPGRGDPRPVSPGQLGPVPVSRDSTAAGAPGASVLPPFKRLLNLARFDEEWLTYGEEHIVRKVYCVLHRGEGWNQWDRKGKALRRTDLPLIPTRIAEIVAREVKEFYDIEVGPAAQTARRWIRNLEGFDLLRCASGRQRGVNRAFICPWVVAGDAEATARNLQGLWNRLMAARGSRPRCPIRKAIRCARKGASLTRDEHDADAGRTRGERVVDLAQSPRNSGNSLQNLTNTTPSAGVDNSAVTEGQSLGVSKQWSTEDPADFAESPVSANSAEERRSPVADSRIWFTNQPSEVTEDDEAEFLRLVRQVGWYPDDVRLVQSLARNIHLLDLLGDVRTAVSPTSGIANPGG